MIKFFRHIRQNLIMGNKTGKPALPAGRYFKYAIGEIILVVIGILIALHINNRNEERNANRAEQRLLTGLNEEFRLNRSALDIEILNNASAVTALSTVLMQMDNTLTKPYSGRPLDSLLMKCITNPLWESTDFALKEMENSNSLSAFNNLTQQI
jgi:hypothetical protein